MPNEIFPNGLSDMNDILWANGIYNRHDLEWYTKFKRFGIKDPYSAPTGSKEYLFFTKPDLHLIPAWSGFASGINPELSNNQYFNELFARYPGVITQLQSSWSREDSNPFMAILSNGVKNTLDLPAIEADTIDTPDSIYGTAYNYRGWGYKSDETISFSLEFEDTKYLEIYNLVKAYEEYERLKHMGIVTPPNIENDPVDENGRSMSYYIKNKILHDQFSIYKFIVEDDGETIIYYAKLWGVFFKNVPRDTFSEMKTDGGLTYAVEFEAAFVDDMNPIILKDFNSLVYKYKDSTSALPVYNADKRMIDGSWATIPIIAKNDITDGYLEMENSEGKKVKVPWNGPKNMKHIYKLKWRK